MSMDAHLIHRCTIERLTVNRTDEYGQGVETWNVEYDRARCRFVEKTKPVIVNERAERAVVAAYQLLVAANVDLQARDRVRGIVLEDGSTDDRIFVVKELLRRRGNVVRHRVALLTRVE